MIFMAIRLFKVVSLAALVVFPAYGQSPPGSGQKIVAITTYFQFITEDDVDQRTKLDLLVAPVDLMKSLEEKGIRLDTLRKRLRSDVARERLARMPSQGYEDRLDYPLIPKM
jgi:hypothetical protein